MKSIEKEKICASCEGCIPLNADTCRYCGMEQNMNENTPLFQSQTLEDSLTSLYTPPYQGKRPNFGQPASDEMAFEEPAMQQEEYHPAPQSHFEDPFANIHEENEQDQKAESSLWPTILLIAGSNFFLLGLMQLFFSSNGILRLEWDASHWFFYWLLSAPFLFFGVKKLKKL